MKSVFTPFVAILVCLVAVPGEAGEKKDKKKPVKPVVVREAAAKRIEVDLRIEKRGDEYVLVRLTAWKWRFDPKTRRYFLEQEGSLANRPLQRLNDHTLILTGTQPVLAPILEDKKLRGEVAVTLTFTCLADGRIRVAERTVYLGPAAHQARKDLKRDTFTYVVETRPAASPAGRRSE